MENSKSSEMRKLTPLWIGQLLSLMGSSVVQFALIWYVTQETGSVFMLALCTLMNYIPVIFLGTVIGNAVDKMNKKSVMIITDLISAFGTFVFLLLVKYSMDSMVFILILFFLKSVCQQFQSISMMTSVSKMVSDENLSATSGINQSINGFSTLAAPLLGSLLISKWPLSKILLIDVVTAMLGCLSILFFCLREDSVAKITDRKTLWQQFSILKKNRTVFRYSLLAGFLNMEITPSASLLPLLVNNELQMNATVLGLLQTAFAIGIVVAGILLGIMKIKTEYHKAIKLALYLFGVMFILSGVFVVCKLPIYYMYGSLFLLGCFVSFANTEILALFQSVVEKNEQGLVLGSVGALSTAMIPVGLFIATMVTKIVSVQWWFIIAGIACLCVTTVFFSLINKSIKGKKEIHE